MAVSTRCPDEWLVRLLKSKGILGDRDARGLAECETLSFAQELLRRKLVSKQQLAEAVQNHYSIAFAEPESGGLEKLALSLIPEQLCRRHAMVPLKLEGETIELLMANPLDTEALDAVMALSGRRPIALFGLPDKIDELLSAGYGSESVVSDLLRKLPEEESVECLAGGDRPQETKPGAVGAPVIRLANALIARAIRMGSSDIHIEHDDAFTTIRYRVDGDLRVMLKLPKFIGEGPLVTRVKIMADLDIADRRRPQDGRAKLKVGTREVGLRVSTIPTSFGEKAVLRILDKRQAEVPLEGLGYRPEILERLVRLSESDQGMLLITGPTGSGKTTTLYSTLNRLKSEDVNIVTVEDPIEYRLEGINQVQVNEKSDMTFASVLRSVLRQDPDIVLVGEIRDRETADIAFQAALTGHMVFSTLHTNDSVATINRLLDMGVERFRMAPALIGVASQRLVRRVCPQCRVEGPASPALAAALRKEGFPERQFKGSGCEHCAFTGLKGRVALTELLDLSGQAARDLLNASDGAQRLRGEAFKRGWLRTISEDALWHVANGDVPLEEAAAYFESEDAPGLPAGPSSIPQPRAPRVLIVDDNVDNRNVLKATLSSEGYDLPEVDGGKAAIEEIFRRRPDLVLLDLMMPEVDGFAVVKKLRGELGMADLPVIVVTAMSEADSQALALELGADDYMTKPFNAKILRARIKALFRRKESLSRA